MVTAQLESAAKAVEGYVAEHAGLGPGTSMAFIGPNGWKHEFRAGVGDVLAGAPVSAETRFQIGSISKSVVAAAYAELAVAGAVDLRTRIAEVSSWIELTDPIIEIGHLLTHQSGLMSLNDTVPASKYAVWQLRESSVGFRPGTAYHYSNLGYLVLGYLLEEFTGKPFEESIEDLVFQPGQMFDTSAQIGLKPDPHSAIGHYRDGRSHRPLPHSSIQGGHAGVLSTAHDMALFLRWLLDEGPVAELMLQPRTETDWPGYGYGLGLFTGVMESFGGDRIVHHGGENPGFESVMIGDLDTGAGVVLLTNSYCSPWPAAYYALRVLNAVLEGKDAPGEPDSTEDEVDLEQPRSEGRYEGHYRAHAPLINEYTVFRRNGRLRINVNGAYEEELVDIGGGQYSIGALPSPERVEFGPVVNDQALACTVNGGVYVRF